MKQRWLMFPVVLCLAFFSVAFAQTVVDMIPSLDLAAWGASVLVYAYAVMLFTEAVKVRIKNRFENPPGTLFTIISYVVALAGAYLIHTSSTITDPLFFSFTPPLNWILFGVVSGAAASGWYDFNKEKKS